MQDRSQDVASSSSSHGNGNGSAAPAQRQVLYRKYDPAKARRVSQLSSSSQLSDGQVHPNSAAPPTRVLGGKARSIGSSSAVPTSNHEHVGLPTADSVAKGGQDYFVLQHNDSTAASLALRQRERERLEQKRQHSFSSSGSSNGSLSRTSKDSLTNKSQEDHVNGTEAHTLAKEATSITHGLATSDSRSNLASPAREASQHVLAHPTVPHVSSGSSASPFSRSQSAMASLQRENSTSSRNSGFKQFIPPSAYAAAVTSSTASSPGQLPQDTVAGLKPRMSAHLSSALARGLNNVNGMLEGTTPVRLPQSASTVASAVWNKLPPAVQQLKNEIAWDWDIEDGSNNQHAMPAPADRGLSKSPPQGIRSLSTSAVDMQTDRSKDLQRPTSSASHASSSAISLRSSPTASGAPTPVLAEPWQVTHPNTLRLADQLRLDYTNKQLSTKGMASPTTPPIQRGKQPYRSGYQPRNGVWRDRTDDFMDLRTRRSVRGVGDSNAMLHEERLLRRLEKLVELHFPLPQLEVSETGDTSAKLEEVNDKIGMGKPAPIAAIKTSMSLKPGDVFGRVMRGIGRSSSTKALSGSALRAADQAIVKWQNDKEVTNCVICGAPFNVVTRKHHCRLCGRVVCFLPPNANEAAAAGGSGRPSAPQTEEEVSQAIVPTRTARCSTFVLYERYLTSGSSQSLIGGSSSSSIHNALLSSGSIREVDLGDYTPVQAFASLTAQERDLVEAELDSKRAREVKAGVRVCRECLNTIMKRQKKSQPKRLEPWLRLYNALTELQQDIEVSLPLLSELKSAPEPTVDTVKQFNSTRKTLLKSLTSYDMLAKRIRDLPATAGSPLSPPMRSNSDSMNAAASHTLSSSQDRLQKAIYNKAMIFLGEKMAVIKGMGGLSVKMQAPAVQESAVSQRDKALQQVSAKLEKEKEEKEQEEKMARLAVLYEQEALVSGYFDDATARRQFEDAAALKASLDDLRAEIQNLLR